MSQFLQHPKSANSSQQYVKPSLTNQAGLHVLLEIAIYLFSSRAAWAAARRAMGTRNGEQET